MKLYTVINNANSCYTGKFNTKEEAQALADKLNDEAIEQGNHQIFYNVGLVEFEDEYYLGHAVVMELDGKHGYVYDTSDIEDGGWVDLPEDGILSEEEANELLAELKDYCTANGYKNVNLYVEGIKDDGEVEDVELDKGNYNTGDTLTWSYMGKEYSCTGEFFVDADNKLHHTFVAPSGREIEIICDYE